MTAKFKFYWDMNPEHTMQPYYNTDAGSTVRHEDLVNLGIAIPLTPTLSTWEDLVDSGKRCAACWSEFDCIHGTRGLK